MGQRLIRTLVCVVLSVVVVESIQSQGAFQSTSGEPVIFEKLQQVQLTRSQYDSIRIYDLDKYRNSFKELWETAKELKYQICEGRIRRRITAITTSLVRHAFDTGEKAEYEKKQGVASLGGWMLVDKTLEECKHECTRLRQCAGFDVDVTRIRWPEEKGSCHMHYASDFEKRVVNNMSAQLVKIPCRNNCETGCQALQTGCMKNATNPELRCEPDGCPRLNYAIKMCEATTMKAKAIETEIWRFENTINVYFTTHATQKEEGKRTKRSLNYDNPQDRLWKILLKLQQAIQKRRKHKTHSRSKRFVFPLINTFLIWGNRRYMDRNFKQIHQAIDVVSKNVELVDQKVLHLARLQNQTWQAVGSLVKQANINTRAIKTLAEGLARN